MNGLDKVIEHLNHAHLDALLNPPTNDMILEHLKKEMGHISADYIEFLKQCNGLTLYHSGDYCLFDAQEILSFHAEKIEHIFRKYCYHQTVKEYKSNGSLIRSKTDYYQAIGG